MLVNHCIYSPTYWMLNQSFNNWKIIQLSQKSALSDTFDELHQVFIYVITDNMDLLVESGKYGVINIPDTTTNGFYVIMLTS